MEPPARTSSLEEGGHTARGEKTGHYPGSHCQKAGRTVKKVGVGSKKKRGPAREHITLGGLKKVDKANKRRVKSRMRKKLGDQTIPEGRKQMAGKARLAPIRSVMFVENTGGGELAREGN